MQMPKIAKAPKNNIYVSIFIGQLKLWSTSMVAT